MSLLPFSTGSGRATAMRLPRPSSLARRLAFGWLLAAGLAQAAGPEPRWVQQHYGSVDGLPVDSASSARIDVDGFLWLATHDGLARFDGRRFDVHDSMRFPAMSGNRVQSLHTDARGRLFAYTAHGDWLAVRSGRIERADLGTARPQAVRHVDPDSLCLTTGQALHCPDGKGAFPVRVPFPAGAEPALALPARGDAAWMVTMSGEVWSYRAGSWQRLWQPSPRENAKLPHLALVDADGALWCAAQGRLLRVTDTGSVTHWQDDDGPRDLAQLRRDADGVWIGAANGLYLADAGGPRRIFAVGERPAGSGYRSWRAADGAVWVARDGELWRSDARPDGRALAPPVLSSSGAILDLLFGDDGTVWVMTLRDGIHRLNRARVELLDEAIGLDGGNIYGVARDADGTMWLGSLGQGLRAVDRDGHVHPYGRAEGLPGDNPWLVAAAPDGSIYAGTYAPGLWRRAAGASRFEVVALPDELLGEQVLAIRFDGAGRLLLGTTAGAWRQERDAWRRLWPQTAQRLRVNALALSDGGEIWFGGTGGVWRRSGDAVQPVAAALLSHTSVRDLYRSGDGALWISTEGRGLVRVAADDADGAGAVRLGRAEGLPSNSPHTVREDAQGNLWVNSNQGIFRVGRPDLLEHLAGRRPRLSPLVLGLSDGLSELEGNGGVQPAAAFDAQGRLWFPSQRGIVRFDPLAMPLRRRAPLAVIDGLESDGRALAGVDGEDLPIGVRNLLVRYGAADLRAGAQVRFRYRLLPLEQGWTELPDHRAAGFSGLAPGRYRFELLAGNSDGIWADAPTAFEFRIPPRWYETGAFRFLLLAVAGLLVLAAVRLRVGRLRRRAVELDRQVRRRTDELRTEKSRVEAALSELAQTHAELARTHGEIEHSNLRLAEQAQRLETLDRFRSRLLADVSHELRTPVMLVSLPLQELHERAGALVPADRGRLDLSLRQLDRLRGLVEQLVGLVQAESGQMRLRLRRLDLAALLREIVDGYRPMAGRAGAELALEADGERRLFGDREYLTTVFGNLIDNAIKHAPPGSRVSVRLHGNDEDAVVEVQDQGPGFDPALATQLFERFFRVAGPPRQGREGLGIGLALARELVELHGGRIAAASARGAGATFRVELPLGSAHVALDDLALAEAPVEAALPEPGTRADGDGRVLLVEDHPDLAAYLAERLGERVPVVCAGSAEQAWRVLADDAGIRLVVSDVVLPGASGVDLCRRLSEAPAAQRRPVILISAKAADRDREAGLAAGAAAYLAKPFGFQALLQAIERAWPAAAARLAVPPADGADVDALLGVALGRIEASDFSVADWAARAHLSERQLRRRVHELTGQSPQAWLREQRLLRVRHLLRSGACRTLVEAGARCGLDNPAYLYRSYRARFGEH
jgi:signal transduction histidine kinase/DNA-binding response OmpR family regulator